jgi:hypothetical protein
VKDRLANTPYQPWAPSNSYGLYQIRNATGSASIHFGK